MCLRLILYAQDKQRAVTVQLKFKRLRNDRQRMKRGQDGAQNAPIRTKTQIFH